MYQQKYQQNKKYLCNEQAPRAGPSVLNIREDLLSLEDAVGALGVWLCCTNPEMNFLTWQRKSLVPVSVLARIRWTFGTPSALSAFTFACIALVKHFG